MKFRALIPLACAVVGLPVAAPAQVALAARASTLGIGGELSFRAGRNIAFRFGGNYLQFTTDKDVEGVNYHLTPHFENGTAILDLHPFGGSFHLSGGVLLNYNEGEMVATLTQDIQIGNQTYTPQQVGSLTGTVSFNRTAPYLGLGFAGRSRVALLIDLGVGITGKPKVDLVGATNLTGTAKDQFDANVAQEQTEIQTEIDKHKILRFHPVLSLGLKLSF